VSWCFDHGTYCGDECPGCVQRSEQKNAASGKKNKRRCEMSWGRKTLETTCNGQVGFVEETLSDGSKAYGVTVFGNYIPCRSVTHAGDLYNSFTINAA
jgi:hypothetical protein